LTAAVLSAPTSRFARTWFAAKASVASVTEQGGAVVNRGELRQLVRDISRTETHDVSNAVLDTYMAEAYAEVVSHMVWPWGYALTPETVTLVVDQNEYTLDDKVKRVLAVIEKEQRYPLTAVSQNDWARTQDSIHSTSRPVWYTFAKNTLFLWPVPATTDSLDVYFYEHPAWGTPGAPDDADVLPYDEAFHTTIVDWSLSRLWEQEEDLEKADDYRRRFEVKLNRMVKFYNTEMVDRPLIFGGGADNVRGRPSSMPWLSDARLGGAG